MPRSVRPGPALASGVHDLPIAGGDQSVIRRANVPSSPAVEREAVLGRPAWSRYRTRSPGPPSQRLRLASCGGRSSRHEVGHDDRPQRRGESRGPRAARGTWGPARTCMQARRSWRPRRRRLDLPLKVLVRENRDRTASATLRRAELALGATVACKLPSALAITPGGWLAARGRYLPRARRSARRFPRALRAARR